MVGLGVVMLMNVMVVKISRVVLCMFEFLMEGVCLIIGGVGFCCIGVVVSGDGYV